MQTRCLKISVKLTLCSLTHRRRQGMTKEQILKSWTTQEPATVFMEILMKSSKCFSEVAAGSAMVDMVGMDTVMADLASASDSNEHCL